MTGVVVATSGTEKNYQGQGQKRFPESGGGHVCLHDWRGFKELDRSTIKLIEKFLLIKNLRNRNPSPNRMWKAILTTRAWAVGNINGAPNR